MLRFWATIIGCCLLVARRVISQLPEDCDYVGYTTTYISETGNQSFTTLTPVGICLISTQQYWDSPVTSTLTTCSEDGTVYLATYVGVADCTGTPLELIAVSDQYATYAELASTHNVSLSAVSQCGTGNVCPHRIVRNITPLEGADTDCSESGKTPVDGQEYYDEASILGVCTSSSGVSWEAACNAEGVATLSYYIGSDLCDAGAQGVTLQTEPLAEVGTFDYCDTYGSTVVQSVSCEATPVQFAGPQSVEIAPLDTLDCDFFSLAVSGPALAPDNSTYNVSYISHWPLNICVTETQLSGLDGSTVTGHRSHIVCENGEIFFKQYNLADTDCTGLALHSFPFAEYFGFDEAEAVDAYGYSVSITANCDTGNICDHAIFREFDDASDCSPEASTPTESDVYTEEARMVGACDIFPVNADSSYAYADVCEGDRLNKILFTGEECSGPFAVVSSAAPGEYVECDAGYTKTVLVSASCETTTTATTTTTGPGTGGTTSTTSSADTTTTVVGGGNGAGSGATTAVSSIFGLMFANIFFLSLYWL